MMNAAQPVFGGGACDAIVTKLNPAGNALVFSTYLGGKSDDEGLAIAVDATGAAYVTGLAQSLPTTAGAYQPIGKGGGGDAFVTKYTVAGILVYSTYLGGSSLEWGTAIAVNGTNAYVTGLTRSLDFPTTAGAFRTTAGGGGNYDIFVTQLNAAGTALVYSTYIAGTLDDVPYGIAADPAGNVFVGGKTQSTDFPVTPGAFQNTFPGGFYTGFITKLNPTGAGLVYSTYLGKTTGTPCSVNAIAIDGAGNVYATGNTTGNKLPLVGAFQPANAGGGGDAFVTVLNPTGSALVMSSYLGGSGYDEGFGIGVDAASNIYVAGFTDSTNFPTLSPMQAANAGGTDVFIAKVTVPPKPTPGVDVVESGASTDVTEGGATDTYTVVLNGVPTNNVVITVSPDAQVTVAPASLTFTPLTWKVPQIVTVTAVNWPSYVGPHTGTIIHTAVSLDAGYNGLAIVSVIANVTDPRPPGGEGNYAECAGPPAALIPAGEGGFGFGGMMPAPPPRFPSLRGPIPDGPGGFLVFNVAHQQATARNPDTGFPWMPLGCVSIAVLALGLIANRIVKYRAA
jgi:hypothetical protein